ncbi:alpha/beta fold hydrolase [Nocardia spumae]|uniref:alpha/beta fold hydrolase n=1 Tax=Nocardia spumae TaxID=2887190 RepID=UPI0035565661
MPGSDIIVTTPLGDLHATVAGTGETIVLWPSLLMDASLWQAQVDHFSRRYRTVAIDPPGHGRSAPLTRVFDFGECARCVVAVLDHLGVDRAHIVGNSWGAMIGGTFAATFPDRVRTAVLLNGTASPAPRRQRLEYSFLLTCARLLGGVRPPLTPAVVRAFLGPTSRRTRPQVVGRVRTAAAAHDVASVSWAVRSVVMRRPDQRALFASITCPVLVIAGREDPTFPLAEVEAMARAVPTARLVVLDDAAHLAAAEVPEQVNSLIAGFFEEHAGTS